MYERQKDFQGFGIIADLIVSSIEATALGVSYAVQRDAAKDAARKEKRTQQQLLTSLSDLKSKELAHKEALLQTKVKTQLFQNLTTKQLVLMGGAVVVGLAVLGTGLFVKFSNG